jgi:hypothetical protein
MFFDNQNAGRSSTTVAGGCASHTRASSTDRVGISCCRGSYDVLDIAARPATGTNARGCRGGGGAVGGSGNGLAGATNSGAGGSGGGALWRGVRIDLTNAKNVASPAMVRLMAATSRDRHASREWPSRIPQWAFFDLYVVRAGTSAVANWFVRFFSAAPC